MALAALPAFAMAAWTQKMLGIDPDGEAARPGIGLDRHGRIGRIAGGARRRCVLCPVAGALRCADFAVGDLWIVSWLLTWPYATALFSHAGTIGLLSIALWGALGESSSRRDVIAGLAAGFAVASEYPAILAGAPIGLYLASLDLRRMWRFGLATLPAAALILVNNYAISGSPFKLSYGSDPLFPELTAVNAFGFNLPDLAPCGRCSGVSIGACSSGVR